LRSCANIDLERMAPIAEALLAKGAKRTPRMKEFVARIGKEFEFHRAKFNPELVEAASAALDRLYELFDVPPAPRRIMHDGHLPIVPASKEWRAQFEELWNLLVPPCGPAETIQGEVVRLAGKLGKEIDGNGGCNWDADFVKMADSFLAYVQQGERLTPSDLDDAATLIKEIKRKDGDMTRLAELAVTWVLLNPTPRPLPSPPYRR